MWSTASAASGRNPRAGTHARRRATARARRRRRPRRPCRPRGSPRRAAIRCCPTWKNSGGKPSKSREQRRDFRARVQVRRRNVEASQHEQVREPDQRVAAVVGGHARAAHRAVDGRREQHRARGQRLAGGARRAVQRDEGEIAAGRIAGQHDVRGIDALREQPAIGGVAVVRRRGKRVLGREPVIGDQRLARAAAGTAAQRATRARWESGTRTIRRAGRGSRARFALSGT